MSTNRKATALKVWLVLFAIWPMIHHGMVMKYDISPWKLFGWSMYCKPSSPVMVELHSLRPDGATKLMMLRDFPPELHEKLADWINRRRVWGTLTSPRELASAVFARWSSMSGVQVRVFKWELSPSNGWYEIKKQTYAYNR